MNKIKILGIVGSLRQDSYNAFALKAAQALVPNDVALELIDLHGIPLYSQDDEMSPPSAVQALKQRILEADAILFATPEYNLQLFAARRAEKCDQLGFAALWRDCLEGQAGGCDGGIGRQPRHGTGSIPFAENACCARHAGGQSAGSDDLRCGAVLC